MARTTPSRSGAVARYLDAVRRGVRAGTFPRLDTPAGFSTLLARYYLDQADFTGPRRSPLVDLSHAAYAADYRRTLFGVAAAAAPRGFFGARGMHMLWLPDEAAVRRVLAADARAKYRSWSFNAPSSVARFGTPRRRPYSADVVRLLRAEQPLWIAEATRRRGKGTLAAALKATETPVVFFAWLPPEHILRHGQDTESHELEEAEVHVRRCGLVCVERAYVLAPRGAFAKAPPASAVERRYFGLSDYWLLRWPNDPRGRWDPGVVLHADADLRGMARALRTRLIRVQAPPPGRTWRRVL